LADAPIVLRSKGLLTAPEVRYHPPKRGEQVSILDAALMESGLMEEWLHRVAPMQQGRWAAVEGRRPQLHHDHPLQLEVQDQGLVQATGRVVELLKFSLDETTVDQLVSVSLEHRLASVKLRFDIDPALQPKLQGSLDRQLKRRHGDREGFVAQHPHGDLLLLCVCPSEAEPSPPI
jgi:hypothetical protein